jgi:hypothetical protein
MLTFRLIGICICSSLLSGCAIKEMSKQEVTINQADFDRARKLVNKSNPQVQCPPPGFPTPATPSYPNPQPCSYKLKIQRVNDQLYGQVSRSVIEVNKRDCEKWNAQYPAQPPVICPDPDTYRYINFPLLIDGDTSNIGAEEEFISDPATGKLKKKTSN